MKIYLAADHRGFSLKEELKQQLITQGHNVIDCGATSYNPEDDEVDFGASAVKQMQPEDRGILLCGSGHGMDMTANRFSHIRAILGFNQEVVQMGREHEDANVLVIPAGWTNSNQAIDMIKTFLTTPFSGKDKYIRRLEKIKKLC